MTSIGSLSKSHRVQATVGAAVLLLGLALAAGAVTVPAAAGYGVVTRSNLPSLIAQKIDSAGLNYQVVNAGVSGETTAGGLARVGTVLRQPVDVFVLELGANDVFRFVPVLEIRRNLQGIIDAVRRKNP